MSGDARGVPFPRTVCACAECAAHCRRHPGFLGVGDVERIGAFLGESGPALAAYFRPLVIAKLFNLVDGFRQVTGLAPKAKRGGACVFLTRAGRCRIHAVSPVGCAYFDAHLSDGEGERRSLWFLDQWERAHGRAPIRLQVQPDGAHELCACGHCRCEHEIFGGRCTLTAQCCARFTWRGALPAGYHF